MRKQAPRPKLFSVPDLAILCFVATVIYGVVLIGKEWQTEFRPVTEIDLSISALPFYALMSAIRGIVAYLISLAFTLVVGYVAATSKPAERIILPLLDILQSIPVLGFLPGLLLGLVALFPNTNTGLELAAIIMIFTGQVWNMTFGYYSSLKSIPTDLKEASTVLGLNWWQKLLKLQLPYSAVNLAWNSLMSMAGGWFFLIPCEANRLGSQEYRLPGIGAYMDVAVKAGDTQAVVLAVVAMIFLIVLMDFAIWRPILSWVQRFRLEAGSSDPISEPLMQIWIRESKIVRWIKLVYRDWVFKRRQRSKTKEAQPRISSKNPALEMREKFRGALPTLKRWRIPKTIRWAAVAVSLSFVVYGAFHLVEILLLISAETWLSLFFDTLWTGLRVLGALALSTAWAVPVGIWIGTSKKRLRWAQPVIQILASFPAPMLYPVILGILISLGIDFRWGSLVLIFLGVQWYVLFNVLAGATRISKELSDALSLMKASQSDRWKCLYLPSIFPSLVTGWVTAAGGAWNASVVAEYIFANGTLHQTRGLGATLSVAAANGDFSLLAASLTMMVFIVILLNRVLWSRLYNLAQTRFRMDP